MPWTQADIDHLKKVIAGGAKVSEFQSGETRRKLENRPLSELREILADMEAEVNPGRRAANRRVAGYNSGL